MRFLRLALLLSIIPTLALARGGGGGGGGGSRGGGGGGSHVGGGSSGGFRGGGGSGGFRGGGGSSGFRGGGGSGFVGSGSRGSGFVGSGFRGSGFVGGSRFFGRSYYYPGVYLGFGFGYPYGYGYYDPYYYGAGYYDPYYYAAPYPVYSDPGYVAAPAAPTVVNQNIDTSSGSYYRTADYYLIAFNDHTIRAAVSYRVDGDQIRYTTREHEEMSAPLSSVDRRFSEQINRDRHVEFRLP